MCPPLVNHLALISESNKVDQTELSIVSAALQKQVTRDFGPIWCCACTVDVFERLEDVPIGYWPMIVMDNIGFNAAGIHLDDEGQPFALISASNDNDVWSLTASHECLEMLADPFGFRLIAGDSPKVDQGRVLFLIEVCDPSEAADFGYSVNGVLVSDFYTPRYFDPVVSHGVQYSYTDAISEPREVLPGGYLSWMDPVTRHWWQETWFSGIEPTFRDLGILTANDGSFRSQIDSITGEATAEAVEPGRKAAQAAGLTRRVLHESSKSRAAALHRQIAQIAGQPSAPSAQKAKLAGGLRRPNSARRRKGQ